MRLSCLCEVRVWLVRAARRKQGREPGRRRPHGRGVRYVVG